MGFWPNREDCRSTEEVLSYHLMYDEPKPYAEYVVWYEIGFTKGDDEHEPTLVGFNYGPVP